MFGIWLRTGDMRINKALNGSVSHILQFSITPNIKYTTIQHTKICDWGIEGAVGTQNYKLAVHKSFPENGCGKLGTKRSMNVKINNFY